GPPARAARPPRPPAAPPRGPRPPGRAARGAVRAGGGDRAMTGAARSQALFERAARVIPGGVNSPARAVGGVGWAGTVREAVRYALLARGRGPPPPQPAEGCRRRPRGPRPAGPRSALP